MTSTTASESYWGFDTPVVDYLDDEDTLQLDDEDTLQALAAPSRAPTPPSSPHKPLRRPYRADRRRVQDRRAAGIQRPWREGYR